MSDHESTQAVLSDEETLHKLGYAQELRRRMSGFSNFAVSFTIISILSGCLTLYYFGMDEGGPAVIVWGWPFVGIMTLLVGLAMAEVCSSFPTAGGLYYWAAKLAKTKGPAWSWFTGWFNFIGQVAVTAGIDFGAAFFINAFLTLQFGLGSAPWETVVIFAIVLFVHGLLNQFGIRLVALLNDVSVWCVIGLYIAYVLPTFLRRRQGANFAPGPWNLGRWSAPIGWIAVGWVVLITILFMLPQFGPVTSGGTLDFNTFNYAPVAVIVVIGYAGVYWLVSARKWFTGPRVQGTPEELAAIERELEQV